MLLLKEKLSREVEGQEYSEDERTGLDGEEHPPQAKGDNDVELNKNEEQLETKENDRKTADQR